MVGRYDVRGIILILAAAMAPVAWSGEAEWAAAQAKLQEYRAAQEAGAAARAQQQAESAREQEARAQAALREACILMEQAGALNASDPARRVAYADVLALQENYDLAAEVLEPLVKQAPDNAAYWLKLGEYRMKIGPKARSSAFEALRKAADLGGEEAGMAPVWPLLGDLYWEEGLFELSREQYEHALKQAPDDVWTKIALAADDVRVGKVVQGSKVLDDLGKAAQPFDIATRLRLREALVRFQADRRWFSDTAENHNAYARLLYRAARFPEAVMAASRATQLNPQDFTTWNFSAAIQVQMGNLDKALEAYQRSLEAKSDQPEVQETIQRIQAEKNKLPTPSKPLIMR